mmetsp:Transcript_20872/g.50425  ORF Transcript_20872/g.50425 Transcript_20872/m.50425 type:complete len:299 (-) Transcript_20872:205-1101(-)
MSAARILAAFSKRSARALLHGLGHHLRHHHRDARTFLVQHRRGCLIRVADHVAPEGVGGAFGEVEGQVVLEEHEEGDAKAPEVAGLRQLPSLELLRRHEGGGAADAHAADRVERHQRRGGRLLRLLRFEAHRHPEVDEDVVEAPLVQLSHHPEDVRGLDIAMENFLLVDRDECVAHRDADLDHVFLRQRLLVLFQHLVERHAIEERHGEPEALLVAGARDAPLEQSYHVRALDHGDDPHLAIEAAPSVNRIHPLWVDDEFERLASQILAVGAQLLDMVDAPEGAATDLHHQAVRGKKL